MTREQHISLYREHRDAATEALDKSILAIREDRWDESRKFFEEYNAETKIANKHWGIAQAMWTRKHGRI